MARTKQEVRDFLNSQVGQSVNAKSGVYKGQCVSLIKALLEFLGAPNPYAGRGNAITVNDQLLREGIATNGSGWLTVVVNRDMGRIYENGKWNNYGHIWIDVANEANFEQNGAKALYTTKNTRPIQQGQQFVNLDKWIGDDDMKVGQQVGYDALNKLHHQIIGNWDMSKAYWDSIQGRNFSDLMLEWSNHPSAPTALKQQEFGENALRDRWDTQIYTLQDQLKAEKLVSDGAKKQLQTVVDENKKLTDKVKAYEVQETGDKQSADNFLRKLGQFLAKYWTVK